MLTTRTFLGCDAIGLSVYFSDRLDSTCPSATLVSATGWKAHPGDGCPSPGHSCAVTTVGGEPYPTQLSYLTTK